MADVSLRTDGPHSPEYTAEVGSALAEAVRVLNYATMPSAFPDNPAGLDYPGDIYTLLGHLGTATGRMPQLMNQLARFLRSQAEHANLGDHSHDDPPRWARVVANDLEETAVLFAAITQNIQSRQNDLANMYVKDDGDD